MEIFVPGNYLIVNSTYSGQSVMKDSENVKAYYNGELVRVINIVEHIKEGLIRGQLHTLDWISLKNIHSGHILAKPVNSNHVIFLLFIIKIL